MSEIVSAFKPTSTAYQKSAFSLRRFTLAPLLVRGNFVCWYLANPALRFKNTRNVNELMHNHLFRMLDQLSVTPQVLTVTSAAQHQVHSSSFATVQRLFR